MKKDDIIRKLTSRKLWLSVAGFISLLVVAAGHTESEAAQITSIVMAGATVLGYVIGEGLIDANRQTKEDDSEDIFGEFLGE